jgi:hypothetical protein
LRELFSDRDKDVVNNGHEGHADRSMHITPMIIASFRA